MSQIIKPALFIVALLLILGMLRLAIWQLDRAQQKQDILDQQIEQSSLPVLNLNSRDRSEIAEALRFREVLALGHFDDSRTLFVDSQVRDSKVGYLVFTAFQVSDSNQWLMVNRGWLQIGQSLEELPQIITQKGEHLISGRLNFAPKKPPLLSESFEFSEKQLWPYLDLDKVESRFGISVLPLVVELAPEFAGEKDQNLIRQWAEIGDAWVAKHKAYAFQWFALAITLFIASLILLIKSLSNKKSLTSKKVIN